MGVCGQDPHGMSLHLLLHLEMYSQSCSAHLGNSWLPRAPQPGARLSEKLAASLIFSSLTAPKEMGNTGAAAPGKSLAGGVPILPSLSSWGWVIQPCRRLKSSSSLSQDPQGRKAAQLLCPTQALSFCPSQSIPCAGPFSLQGAHPPSLNEPLGQTHLFQGICSSRRGEMRKGILRR